MNVCRTMFTTIVIESFRSIMLASEQLPKRNRGKNSGDEKLFGVKKMQERINEALTDMHWLLSRGYAERSSLALVGNRYRLNARQQQALLGMSASETQVSNRQFKQIAFASLQGKQVAIDGFNLLIILESFLSGAYVFKGLDGFYRDLSSVHGSYKRVQQTNEAIETVCRFYESSGISSIHWYFDKPVSNSGRLKQLLEQIALERGYNWEINLVFNPDREIVNNGLIAITSDAWILDHCAHSFNFMAHQIAAGTFPHVLNFTTQSETTDE